MKPTKKDRKSIATEFYRGNHREVVRHTVDSASGYILLEDIPLVIGALCFLGRIDEAESAYQLHEKTLKAPAKVACRFFLGIALCRHSHYPKARHYFAKNVKESKRCKDGTSQFYVYQGIGFYRYFSGRLRGALRASQKSFNHALEGKFLYGKALAADLKGHSLIQTGQISLGMTTLQQAEEWAANLGAKWLQEVIQVALVAYGARFGLKPQATLDTLRGKLGELSQQDTYSQSTLLLELAQQLMLRGQLREGKEVLNESCRIIYASQNRRQEVLLNLRYAYAHYLSGDYHQGLNLIRNSLKQLDPLVDKLLELRVLGMELKLLQRLQMQDHAREIKPRIAQLTRAVGETVAQRMWAREEGISTFQLRGEDSLGHLKDWIASEKINAVERVIRSGYLAFLYECLDVAPSEVFLYFDLTPGSLTIFEQGSVEHVADGVSPSIRAVARELSFGNVSKKTLIEHIWKYEYHPLRHDALVYSAIAKLRRLLGERAFWVEATESGYRLNSRVRVLFYGETPLVDSVPLVQNKGVSQLNHRQLKILRYLEKNEFIDASTCKKIFRTSEITATRDLSGLIKLQLVQRFGRARATKYTRASLS